MFLTSSSVLQLVHNQVGIRGGERYNGAHLHWVFLGWDGTGVGQCILITTAFAEAIAFDRAFLEDPWGGDSSAGKRLLAAPPPLPHRVPGLALSPTWGLNAVQKMEITKRVKKQPIVQKKLIFSPQISLGRPFSGPHSPIFDPFFCPCFRPEKEKNPEPLTRLNSLMERAGPSGRVGSK